MEKKGRGSWLLPSRNSQLVEETSLAHLSQLELRTDRWDCGGGVGTGVLSDPGFPESLLSQGEHGLCEDSADLGRMSTASGPAPLALLVILLLYWASSLLDWEVGREGTRVGREGWW